MAGADPDGDVGEFHKPETHLIPLILDAIDGKRDQITILELITKRLMAHAFVIMFMFVILWMPTFWG